MYKNIYLSSKTPHEPSTIYIWDDEKGLIVLPYDPFNYAYKRSPSGNFTSIYGHRLKKVHSFSYDDESLFESDVPRETRVLTDLYLDSDEPSTGHVVGTFDIETSSRGGFPDISKADKEIYSIAFHNSKTEEYMVFLLDELSRLSDKKIGNATVLRFDTEEELLKVFLAWYSEQEFTILTGWNIAYFDIPYLYRRLINILGEDSASMLSPIGLFKWSIHKEQYQIAGVSVLDYLDLYKKFTYTEQPTYRLDAIGTFELDMPKIEYEGTLDNLYDRDLKEFVTYNLRDVEIVVGLDKKMKLIELVRNICHMGHVPYEDYMYSSRWIEGTIITYLHRKNIICPNKPVGGREEMNDRESDGDKGFEGAFVKEPIPGLYEWVFSLDLQSLYPSIIMTLNISPETKIGRVFNWDIQKHVASEIEEYVFEINGESKRLSKSDFVEFMTKMKFSLSSNGILYTTDKLGIIPEILDVWFKQRIEYRKLYKQNIDDGNKEKASYYDRRQHVQKIFLNSIYGVLGLPIFRFYDLDNALAVTATGQDVIKTSAKYVNLQYERVTGNKQDYCIYIDTDSLYFSSLDYYTNLADTDIKKATIDLAQTMELKLNEFYVSMARNMFFVHKDHRLKIKGETVARRAFWIRKKRYAMLKIYDLDTKKDANKIIIKGLDVVRSSFPKAFKEFMSNTLKSILDGNEKATIDVSILEFMDKLKTIHYLEIARNTSIKDGFRKYEDKKEKSLVRFPKGVSLHVKAGLVYNRWLRNKGLDKFHHLIKDGDKIKYVYCKTNPLGINAIAIKGSDDPKEIIEFVEEYVDYKKLFDQELKSKLQDFYSALNWGLLPTSVNQSVMEFFQF